MRIDLPNLDYSRANIQANRETIDQARAAYRGALRALDGMARANEGMCPHDRQVERFDPGYAGGGHSHNECLECGAHL